MEDEPTRLERTSLVVPADRCELRLQDGRITIVKERAAQDEPTGVTFAAGEVRGATLERPTRGQPGWLHLAVVGGTPAPTTDLGSALDPYTLPVTSRNVAAAKRVVRLVTQHVQERGLPTEPQPGTGRVSSSVTVTAAPGATSTTPTTPAPPVPPPSPSSPSSPPSPEAPAIDRGEVPDALDEPTPPAEDRPEVGGLARTLRELADLHRTGVLTDEEFQRAKDRVLGDA
jgi:hypothetical protein